LIKILKKIRNVFSRLFFDPLEMVYKWRAIPSFWKNRILYNKRNTGNSFPITMKDIFYVTYEKYMPAGIMQGHYFFQDIWAAQKVYLKKVTKHVDIASRIDGFVAHILAFTKVEYVDIRKLKSELDNLTFLEGSILQLPYEDASISSLSCLHVIEHIGLGRYGDPIIPEGHLLAAKEIIRVLAPGGSFYLGTPVGKERLCFDAHRVFSTATVLAMFSGLELVEFSLIDDRSRGITKNALFSTANQCSYGCGLFEFTKPILLLPE
jgi:SAM-dependent methyltransferase